MKMIDYKELFENKPFSMNAKNKRKWFLNNLKILSKHHYNFCEEYKKINDRVFKPINKCQSIADFTYIPSSLFKSNIIKTVTDNSSIKTFTSSGTSSAGKSNIVLDKKTSLLQSRALAHIYSDIIKKKTKIFFIDNKDILIGNSAFSARGAAIKGFYQFIKDPEYLLDGKNNLNLKPIKAFLDKFPNEEFIIFGFTSFIWEHLILKIKKKKIKIKKNRGILIHGGGWKKLFDKAVDRDKFNSNIKLHLGINSIHNYYGMIEQTGSIFLECEEGYYHSSIFSDILIRDINLKENKFNSKGIIQVISLLPLSYPGHSILTEDMGTIIGEDDCKCGRKGKYFTVEGRLPNTEIRGCSDVGD